MASFQTSEHEMLRKAVRDFAVKEVRPLAAKIDKTKEFPRENFRKMGELGFHGVTIPPEYGGTGMGTLACAIVNEELGRECASTALSYLAHAVLCVNNLYLNGTDAQRKRWLPKLISGEHIGSWALTEPSSGSDARALKTRYRKDTRNGKKGFVLDGQKMFITNAYYADVIIVFARPAGTDPEKDKDSITVFVVERGMPGMNVHPPMDKMGMRASPTSEITFEDCFVPEENLLGTERKGNEHMLRGLDVERATIAGISVGIAQGALDVAVKYAGERKQFGVEIGTFQMIKRFLADMATETRASRLLVYDLADRLDKGETGLTMEASMAKYYASEVGTRVAMNAVQILGGYGYISEFPVERMARDAKLLEIGAGTSEIQRIIVAREVMKRGGNTLGGG